MKLNFVHCNDFLMKEKRKKKYVILRYNILSMKINFYLCLLFLDEIQEISKEHGKYKAVDATVTQNRRRMKLEFNFPFRVNFISLEVTGR